MKVGDIVECLPSSYTDDRGIVGKRGKILTTMGVAPSFFRVKIGTSYESLTKSEMKLVSPLELLAEAADG